MDKYSGLILAKKISVINKKNFYQQIDFTAFAPTKFNTFVRET